MRSYSANAPAVVDKIRNVNAETLDGYTINTHGLKSMSASIGAGVTVIAAARLESLAKSGDLENILLDNENFIKDTENIIANVKHWIEKYDEK